MIKLITRLLHLQNCVFQSENKPLEKLIEVLKTSSNCKRYISIEVLNYLWYNSNDKVKLNTYIPYLNYIHGDSNDPQIKIQVGFKSYKHKLINTNVLNITLDKLVLLD